MFVFSILSGIFTDRQVPSIIFNSVIYAHPLLERLSLGEERMKRPPKKLS